MITQILRFPAHLPHVSLGFGRREGPWQLLNLSTPAGPVEMTPDFARRYAEVLVEWAAKAEAIADPARE